MGCVSSKHVRREREKEEALNRRRYGPTTHVVSLTSSTYGALKLDVVETTVKECLVVEEKVVKKQQGSPPREELEVINTWELMGDLEEGPPAAHSNKNSPKPRVLLNLITPSKLAKPPVGSPKTVTRLGGKENRGSFTGPKQVVAKSDCTPLKSHNSCKAALGMKIPPVWTPKRNSFGGSGDNARRSLGPLFDPATPDGEQIKKMIQSSPKFRKQNKVESDALLSTFEKKCPPGGENSVVIYTTTLRGIRKTFEECNIVRSVIESKLIQVMERDVSMDSGFKEELRRLMGTKQVKVPLVFVKGMLIGGAEEVLKLEEDGKLEILFDGIARSSGGGCEGCGGMRFVMCVECNGSCKVLNEKKEVLKCGECNENGLIHCPVCC